MVRQSSNKKFTSKVLWIIVAAIITLLFIVGAAYGENPKQALSDSQESNLSVKFDAGKCCPEGYGTIVAYYDVPEEVELPYTVTSVSNPIKMQYHSDKDYVDITFKIKKEDHLFEYKAVPSSDDYVLDCFQYSYNNAEQDYIPIQEGETTLPTGTSTIYIRAVFKEQTTTKHTVSFHDGSEVIATQEVVDGECASYVEPPQKAGQVFKHWTKDGDTAFDFNNTPITEDTTLYTVYEARQYYQVTFGDADHGTYDFTLDDEKQQVVTPLDVDADTTYIVTLDEGSHKVTISFTHDQEVHVAKLTCNPVSGYSFEGFYYNTGSGDIKIEAKLTLGDACKITGKCVVQPTTHTVTFDSQGGTTVDPQIVEDGQCATEPTAPIKEGYKFAGWFDEDTSTTTPFNFTTPIKSDLTLTAHWTEVPTTYTITKTATEGVHSISVKVEGVDVTEAVAGTTVNVSATPESGYEINSITITPDSGTPIVIEGDQGQFTMPASNVTITATSVVPTTAHTVTFDSKGGSAVDSQTVEDGECAKEPTAPTKEGYKFAGWFDEDTSTTTPFNFTTPIKSDLTLTAHWTEVPTTYSITKDETTEGVASISAQVEGTEVTAAAAGTTVNVSATPLSGYEINSITIKPDSGTPIVIEGDQGQFTMPASNVTITATSVVPTTTHTVTFDSKGGTAVDPQTVEDGECAIEPTAPTKEGFEFAGWFNEDASTTIPFNFTTPITSDLTLTAHWTAVPTTYTITKTTTEGVASISAQVEGTEVTAAAAGTTVNVSATPLSGYEINSITIKPDSGTPIVIEGDQGQFTMPASNVTITATSVVPTTTHTVTFDSKGGTAVDPQTVEDGECAIEPTAPTKEGFEFAGWFNEDASTTIPFNFTTPITSDLTLTAHWTAVPVETVTLSGHVYDSKTKEPIAGVDVKFETEESNKVYSTTTDKEGFWKINNITKGLAGKLTIITKDGLQILEKYLSAEYMSESHENQDYNVDNISPSPVPAPSGDGDSSGSDSAQTGDSLPGFAIIGLGLFALISGCFVLRRRIC
ncbi:MAG: InlB B-repeat-containing protein [Coriobacteriia bacterium]|nr:InlB B-repeat-containing protein [Coriobacteriia bacterium]